MVGIAPDITGKSFDRWTVVERAGTRSSLSMWRCRCSCGAEKTIAAVELRRGRTRSCGCLSTDLRREAFRKRITHGECRVGKMTLEYKTWAEMQRRCIDPKKAGYKNYGGRGIRVCDRWLESYENFLADMGRKPTPQHSIDRINNDGNYEPGNCRWATSIEQRSNTRRRKA